MAMTKTQSHTLAIRSGLLLGAFIAFGLDMNGIVPGSQLYVALALVGLYRRDEFAMLTIIPLSLVLLFIAGAVDPALTLADSLMSSRGTVAGSLMLMLGSGIALLRRWAKQEKRWHMLAQTDPLTGLANRRRLDQVLDSSWHEASRYDDHLSILMLDLDHFKGINDDYGHARGDKALRDFSRLVQETIRSCDHAGRYGGEEFMVLCPHTDINGSLRLAERIRHRWEKQTLRDGLPMTVSIGVAMTHAGIHSAKQLVDEADDALYQAKDAGRNRCRAAKVELAEVIDSKPKLAAIATG